MPENTILLSFAVAFSGFNNIVGVIYILQTFFCQYAYPECLSGCLYMDKRLLFPVHGNCSCLGISAIARGLRRSTIQVNFTHLMPPHDKDDSTDSSGCYSEQSFNDALFQVSDNVFANYKQLKVLDLSKNHLFRIPDFLPERLEQLVLSSNKITDLEPRRILFLDFLEVLYINDNLISEVSNRTDSGGKFWQNMHLSNLKRLALQRNHIKTINCRAFRHLPFLTTLLLNGNQITSLYRETFEGLYNLKELDLSDNLIQQSDSYTFQGLTVLTYLNLQRNHMTVLPKGLPMLEWLDVSHNLLQNISEEFKPEIYAIEFSNFADNPLFCDCNLLWLKEAYDRREHLIQYMDIDPVEVIPSCSFPEHLNNETWDVLSDDAFVCEEKSNLMPKSEEQIPELQVKGEVLNESSVAVVWRYKNRYSSPARILIYYYVFGLKSTTLRHVKVAVTEQQYILSGLSSLTNYMICINMVKILNNVEPKLESTPLLLDQCIEVTTKVPQHPSETTYFAVYWWYVLTMMTTFVTVIGCIAGLALLCSLLNHRHMSMAKSTYPVDEPLPVQTFCDTEEFHGSSNSVQ